MEREPEDPQAEPTEQQIAPPFDPDPRLVTFREGGKKGAEAFFLKEMERRRA